VDPPLGCSSFAALALLPFPLLFFAVACVLRVKAVQHWARINPGDRLQRDTDVREIVFTRRDP
jgi:hypothetical protein